MNQTTSIQTQPVASYRAPELNFTIPPWTLGRSVNGFTLGDGQEWHRQDFTREMLPDGWRPVLLMEDDPTAEQVHNGVVTEGGTAGKARPSWLHLRTRRPLPAVEKPDADGWIAHDGGLCPVSDNMRVDLKLSDGKLWSAERDDSWIWEKEQTLRIIAYRPVAPKVVPWTRETCPPLPFEVVDKRTGDTSIVAGKTKHWAYVSGMGDCTWVKLLNEYTTTNGQPCGEVQP